jgi:hypothetical protein
VTGPKCDSAAGKSGSVSQSAFPIVYFAVPWTPALKASAEAAAHSARDQRDQEQHQGDEEHDLGDAHCGAGNTTKSENGRDQGDDQKRNDEAQHRIAPRCRIRAINSAPAVPVPSTGLMYLFRSDPDRPLAGTTER